MNRRYISFVLVSEAIICSTLAIAGIPIGGLFTLITAFPFAQLGLGLRALSLSGKAGNTAAIILYALICLAPIIIIYPLKRKTRLHIEDGLLLILSILLFVVMYQMINPGLISLTYGEANNIPYGKGMLGGIVYSVICTYGILRILRLLFSKDTRGLQRWMKILLILLNLLFIYIIFGAGVGEMIDSFKVLRSGNIGNEHLLGPSYVFLVLKSITDNIPHVMNIFIVFAGISLLHALMSNPYSAETIFLAQNLSKVCKVSLAVTLLTNMVFNILQLVFSKMLFNINSLIQIPIFSIGFVLAVLLFSRFIAQSKALKDENESII